MRQMRTRARGKKKHGVADNISNCAQLTEFFGKAHFTGYSDRREPEHLYSSFVSSSILLVSLLHTDKLLKRALNAEMIKCETT